MSVFYNYLVYVTFLSVKGSSITEWVGSNCVVDVVAWRRDPVLASYQALHTKVNFVTILQVKQGRL
jgi:hypothetical protein